MKWRTQLVLSVGHAVADYYPGLLPALLPLITKKNDWSLAMAGILVMVIHLCSNLIQPIMGVLHDRRPSRHYMWIGLVLAGLPFGVLLYLDNLNVMIAAMAISGLGVGMYHPAGVVAAGEAADRSRKGLSMAVFSAGGSLGFVISPPTVVLILSLLGEEFFYITILPALLMAGCIFADRGINLGGANGLSLREWLAAVSRHGREMLILLAVASCRAIVYLLLSAFMPLLAMARGATFTGGAYLLSITLFAAWSVCLSADTCPIHTADARSWP